MKTQKDFYKVVNFDGQDIEMLDYVFEYEDGMKGATGTRFQAVSLAYYKEYTKKSSVIELLEGCMTDQEILDNWGNDNPNCTVKTALNRWYKAIKDAGEIDLVMFDNSYYELWDYLREELNLSDKEAYIFTCTGGGRMFSENYQGNINPELSAIIRQYENN